MCANDVRLLGRCNLTRHPSRAACGLRPAVEGKASAEDRVTGLLWLPARRIKASPCGRALACSIRPDACTAFLAPSKLDI
jgi:hypothetical protein